MMYNSLATAALLLLSGAADASPLVGRQDQATPSTSAAASVPTPATPYDWSKGWQKTFPIHQSCNSTLRAQLEVALAETQQLAGHARDHILRFGNESEHVRKYFGNASTATAVGWYERVVNADKTGMTFRCDDPDRNCATQEGWAGHWRGSNATQETVICPLSFQIRRPLTSVCGLGYNVANSRLNTFWATDLLHRAFHVPLVSLGQVEHYAEDYAEVLDLAKNNATLSVLDSDALQYFAIDVWAYDIAAPGVGCSGELEEEDKKEETPAATTTPSSPAATTSSAPQECHTHADGALHCV
ncbi:Antigen 1 [Colletotrichum truncatum]|uniref:Antigen 1 n=1 Tax=Colletotrichum truncatum TaxID=5467 RepID=A0ACC3YF45_COLTU|nr:Antigen 1 [Colletotrichum truncatum]KAF6785023.1 Antigen 1 [Colletotrichum truncatum]